MIFLIWNIYNAFQKNHPLEKNRIEEEGVLILNPSENGSYYLWNQKPIELPSHWELRHIRPILHKTIKLRGYYSRKSFLFGIIKLSALHALSLDQFSIDKEMQNGFFIKKPIIQLLHIPMIIFVFQFLIFTSEIGGDLNEQKKILEESSLPASALPSIENINSIQNEFYIFLILFIFLCFLESFLIFYTIRLWKYNTKISNAILKNCYEINLN